MLLEEAGERTLQLTRAVSVNEAHDALIGQERFVEEPLRARDRFVDRAADHIQIRRRRVARLERDRDVHPGRRGSRRVADEAQVAQARAHPLPADVEIRGAVVKAGDDGFEAEAADDDAIADLNRRGDWRLRARAWLSVET